MQQDPDSIITDMMVPPAVNPQRSEETEFEKMMYPLRVTPEAIEYRKFIDSLSGPVLRSYVEGRHWTPEGGRAAGFADMSAREAGPPPPPARWPQRSESTFGENAARSFPGAAYPVGSEMARRNVMSTGRDAP